MKKLVKWMLAAILICGTATTLTSCEQEDMDDIVNTANVIGTWKSSDMQISPTPECDLDLHLDGYFTFNANGTFTDCCGKNGRWTLRNKMITLIYPNGDGRNMQYTIQGGYSRKQMVLMSTINTEDGNHYLCSIILKG
ncbi:MAG: hypothetical protein J6Y97_14040 [Prevotella sp.]|nr:hypothetical protein [Prevotella sp.]